MEGKSCHDIDFQLSSGTGGACRVPIDCIGWRFGGQESVNGSRAEPIYYLDLFSRPHISDETQNTITCAMSKEGHQTLVATSGDHTVG